MISDEPAGDRRGPTSWSRSDTYGVLAIGFLGLALRLTYALEYSEHPIGRMPWVDEGAYWTRAQEIREGHWLPGGPFYQDPLFPYALAALMKVVGPEIASLRVGLACLGALTPIVVFQAGRRGLGRAEAIVAGLITAVYGPLIFTDGLLEKEGLAALVAALALACIAQAAGASHRARPGWMGVSGWAWGVLALLRANALIIGPLGAVWASQLGRGESQPRRRLLVALFFMLGFTLALTPAVVINAVVGRPPEFLLTTWQSGANFYIGNGPGATGTYWAPEFVEANPAREADDFAAEARRRTGKALTPGQVSRYWFFEGLKPWRNAPGASLHLLAKKFGLLLHDFEIPDNQDIQFVRIVAAPHLALGALSFGWLIPWAAIGLARGDRSPFWWFLTASTMAGLASTAAFFVVARYRIPWTPGLALLGAAGAVDLARRARGRQWRALVWRVGLLALPAAALAWRPLPDPVPDRWGHAEIVLALAELGERHLEPTIDALDDARAFGPGAAIRVAEITAAGPVHDRLAEIVRFRIEMGRREGGPPRLRLARWLRQFPESRAESRRLLESALAENPDDRQARREWGAWWLGEPGNPEARPLAARELALAARAPGGDPSAAILLALLSNDPRLPPRPGLQAISLIRLRLVRAILTRSAVVTNK